MCYAIPGKLVEIRNGIGIVDYFGEKRRVLIDFDNVSIGDYVYAQGGVLINRISEKDALEVLEVWRELFFELKIVDEKLARVQETTSSANVLGILQRANLGKQLRKEELLGLLKLRDENELKLLRETANNIRQRKHGNACCVHGIVEFSNFCKNDCFFCGIRNGSAVERYRMSLEEILDVAVYAAGELGFKALVLQSGEDHWYDETKLLAVVKGIRKLGVLIFLSIGARSKKIYERLFEAGARAALLRFETSSRDIFQRLKPDTTLEQRLELIRYLKSLGYVLATGFLVGLPGETDEDTVNNILLTKSLGPDMYSFGPFVPARGTPLENHKPVDRDRVLATIAICRLVDRDSKILVTTAMETLDSDAKKEGLLSGANSLMLNVTPLKYRSLYRIYDNRAKVGEETEKSVGETINLLHSLGRAPTDLGV